MRFLWIPGAILAAAAAVAAAHHPSDDAASPVGESIYLRGVLGSGAPLEGTRASPGMGATGAAAACVNCHQRSGLGAQEGTISIPPITGAYLFHSRGHSGHDTILPYIENMRGNRDPYTEVSLARAIREGIDSQGRPFADLMPRFALDDADMAALISYLKKMSAARVPGVTDSTLHLATIFTPDSDPVKRAGVLNVLERYVVDKNAFPFAPSPHMWTSGKTQYSKSMYMPHLHWQLHVWQLAGPASSWRAQLEKHLAAEPVFAVLSGLGGSNWAPVHEFCERNAVPCLFPNAEVPKIADHDFYSLYFSKGVLLEAQLIADAILGADGHPGIVQQIYRAGDSGEPAAEALAAELRAQGVTVRNAVVARDGADQSLAHALRTAVNAPVLVLWLRSADIAALGSAPPGSPTVYMSGLMGGLEDSPLPAGWRPRTHLAYPFDLPDRRGVRLDYPLGWFAFRHIPVVAVQVQTDTYLACSLLADVLNNHMADNIVRPYLIEQLQAMLERRLITGYYPRLTLATGERFASRGGYIVHFSGPQGSRLTADGGWIVPDPASRTVVSTR